MGFTSGCLHSTLFTMLSWFGSLLMWEAAKLGGVATKTTLLLADREAAGCRGTAAYQSRTTGGCWLQGAPTLCTWLWPQQLSPGSTGTGAVQKGHTPRFHVPRCVTCISCSVPSHKRPLFLLGSFQQLSFWLGWGCGGRKPDKATLTSLCHLARSYCFAPNGLDLSRGTISRKDAEFPAVRTRLLGVDQFDSHLAKQNKHYPEPASSSQGPTNLLHLFPPYGILGRLSTLGSSVHRHLPPNTNKQNQPA